MKYNFIAILLAGTIISAGLTATPVYAAAQEKPAPEMRKDNEFNREEQRQKMAQKMAEDLGLTAEQQEKAKAIREKGRAELEPLMKEMRELREKMDAKRRANMEEFESILTPEQKAKFESFKKNPPHPHGEHGFAPRGPEDRHGMDRPHDVPQDRPLPPED